MVRVCVFQYIQLHIFNSLIIVNLLLFIPKCAKNILINFNVAFYRPI